MVATGSVMVPCPWFPEIAAWSQAHPEGDLGLHLTLTSEWQQYRWRPVAPPDQVKGLLDPDGFMWRSVAEVKAHASAREVETEIRAQVRRARHFGLKPTHVDSHMGTLFSDPGLFEVYVRVSRELGLLPMLMEPTPDILAQAKELGLDYPPLVERLRGQGYLFLTRLITGATVQGYEARKRQYHGMIRALTPGVTEIILHLAGDDEEIRHVTGNWQYRYDEFRIFTDADTRALLTEQRVRLIGYRPLARLWEKATGTAAG
jgi:predicted glycoside hydrolase/deacetylase ChbG (UPF0249 family)